MLEGRCPKCGCCYVGWALQFPRNQTCNDCGAALEIYLDGQRVSEGYSPFDADKYSINLPSDTPSSRDKVKNRPTQDKHHS